MSVPERTPAVTATRSVPPTPPAVLHMMVVSAFHSVASVAVKPSLMATLLSEVAKSAPIKMMSPPPVPLGTLPPVSASTYHPVGASYESTSVIVPTRIPAVTASRYVPLTPVGALHRSSVSADHSVNSQAVAPTLIVAE